MMYCGSLLGVGGYMYARVSVRGGSVVYCVHYFFVLFCYNKLVGLFVDMYDIEYVITHVQR